MARGGPRPGAGRKKGARNKRTAALITKAEGSGMLPHEFLCAVSQGMEIDGYKPSFDERIDAAKAAAPFYAPKLQSTAHSGGISVKKDASDLSDEELSAIAATGGAGAADEEEGAGQSRGLH